MPRKQASGSPRYPKSAFGHSATQHANDQCKKLKPMSPAANCIAQVMDTPGSEMTASAGSVEAPPEPHPDGQHSTALTIDSRSTSYTTARLTRYQLKLQLQMQKPFRFLDLSADIRYMVFDKLFPKKIYLRKRYTGIGGNSTVALILRLLHINQQLRKEGLGYIYCMKPIFSISIHDAHAFPLPLLVKRLHLRTVELDERTMFRSNNDTFDCLPTDKTDHSIQMFGHCWSGHSVEELRLCLLMAPNTEYRGVAFGTNLTVTSVFAPLGHFNKVHVRCRPVPHSFAGRVRACRRAFKGVAETLASSLRLSSNDSS